MYKIQTYSCFMCLPTGKQAEMESRRNFHSYRTLKTKVQGGCNAIETLEAHVMDYITGPCYFKFCLIGWFLAI